MLTLIRSITITAAELADMPVSYRYLREHGFTTVLLADGWGVSYETGGDYDGAELRVCKVEVTPQGTYGDIAKHPIHGQRFSSVEDAQQFAFHHGLLMLHRYLGIWVEEAEQVEDVRTDRERAVRCQRCHRQSTFANDAVCTRCRDGVFNQTKIGGS